jgi:hypothetical protein
MNSMAWEYRVMVRDDELAIYEVYYYEDGGIRGYSSNPVFPAGGTLVELTANLELYAAALAKPVLTYRD